MTQHALEVVKQRNNYYRNNYRRTLTLLLMMLALTMLLVGVVVYQYYTRPDPIFFATSPDGRITELKPLDVPVVSGRALISWAEQAAVAAYTFNFNDYQTALDVNAKKFFTPQGWSDFRRALVNEGVISDVVGEKLSLTAVVNGAPVITKEGPWRGRYSWMVQLPVLLNTESAGQSRPKELVVQLLVTRVSPKEVPKGIAVAQYVAVPAGGSLTG